jgi:hypothetical protein
VWVQITNTSVWWQYQNTTALNWSPATSDMNLYDPLPSSINATAYFAPVYQVITVCCCAEANCANVDLTFCGTPGVTCIKLPTCPDFERIFPYVPRRSFLSLENYQGISIAAWGTDLAALNETTGYFWAVNNSAGLDKCLIFFRGDGGVVIGTPIVVEFDHSSASKKGLLGLLGLLGLIPLILCCCLLLLCCLRRKKREGDVHFATFDPCASAAPSVCAVPPPVCAMGLPAPAATCAPSIPVF